MLFLPIALDKNEVRRTPWVTWSLIGTCFLVHMAIATFGADAEREASRRIEESLQYLGEHPYLSPSPPLLELLGNDGRAALARALAEWEAAGGSVPPLIAEQQQQQLNEITDEAFASLRRLPSSRLGFVPARPNPLALVTYTFVHAGWFHLIGNMLFLFLTGPFIEDLYGRPLFGVLYFLSGIAGAGAFAAGAPHTEAALVGASGAIAGVMGAFLVRLATRRIEFLVMPVPIIPAFRFHLKFPAFVVIPLWAGEQLYYASVAKTDSPVAFSAHVGGFLVGLIFAGAIALLGVEERFINPAIEREISIEQNPVITRAADARVAGDLASARRLIDGALRAEPGNVDAWTESWEIALEARDPERAGQSGLRLLDLHGRGTDRDMVWAIVNDPRWRELRMPSRFLSTVADLLARAGDGREAIEIYRRQAAEAPPGDVAVLRALVSEGELLMRAGDPKGARQAFDRARSHPSCSEPWVERMQRALQVSRPTRGGGP
jgi:membrane associated rhomboid family serine protease